MIIGLFQDAHNTSFRSHSWLKARGSISALVEGMDYDSLAFSTAGRQAPKLGTCLECRALVDIEFSLDRAGVYSTSPCPQCGSKRVRAVPDPASAEQQQQQSGGGSAAAGGADAMRRMQAMFAAFGLPADVQSAAMAAVSSIGNASGGGAASGAAAAASGSAAEAAAAALPSGGPIDAANLEALAAAQQGVDIDALMLALLQDASRKAPPALPSFVDALPNEPLAFADALEVWFEICAPRSASSGASPVTAADASATAISFTLPAFGPRLVSLHRRIDEDDASNGGDGMSQDDNERPPPARQVLGEAQIIVADDAEGAAPRNADQWRGKCVLFQRGKITFLEKIRRAQQAGAAAVLVVQTAAQWPYQMTDATNSSTAADLAAVFMISKNDGRELVDRIAAQQLQLQQQQPHQQTAVSARWGTVEKRPFCAICREQFAREERAMRLPCAHPFHAECVRPWLAQRNSCPLCRHEMPTGDADIDARLNQSAAVAAAASNRDAAYEQLRVSMWG